ncbi:valine--tRNA ligase [Flavihumibacter sp. CACIAM 22H1]|uniref:valine--tRNA ligase n=1 Tax=Flavihumibacter sp. CACIAM 22H1 TaxID=1812911 RepID=UPI0007A8E799|nr:valine--tRNA ligase [Flavihumibacter sp. CACIAM 22H1]KYP14011.1 MAG: valine--tRNA ligase [Flavihumibacter sp. CACIAM 22H1]
MELTKNFQPAEAEVKWTSEWKKKNYFTSRPDHRPAYTVVIPPPNVTGVLHMGHTLNETVQDILVRKARMSGFNACWVPGSDHASIATEAKVVQMLEKEKGIKKADLSRDEFLGYAFEWKEKYGGIIYNQIERLGCSVDWNRVSFTMDDHYYKAVIQVFVDLYKKGLIYRGARMINWDPAAKTALSDEEVEYKDIQGKLYHVCYRLESADGQPLETAAGKGIVIATQRPETIMGDTAICVNPNDPRYTHLKGAFAYVPLINRRIPIIEDEYVDPSFGTGALKVTPAHDINDYNLGLKHQLDVVDTLNEDGTLSAAAQIHVGVDRFKARKLVVDALKENGQLIKEEEYSTRLGYSQRSGAVVEPRISTQWFVRMKELAEPALAAVVSGEIRIHPGDKFLATYKYWLENVKDWCISRQLWWGQQIPAWYAPDGSFQVAATRKDAMAAFEASANNSALSFTADMLKQDEDVLDTWFSSWLWPMEVFNGITKPGNEEIRYYYPTSVLVTGQDIIFFWVARMVMAGMEYEKQIPFRDVYFTGMVRDKQGRKMSKSLGNSPDLLELIDKYGADAVRFGIMISSPAGNDLLFDEAALEQGRNFTNKMWNALKLITMWKSREQFNPDKQAAGFASLNWPNAWFRSRLNQVRVEVDQLMQQFRLSEALKTIYSLIWDDYCSWYLEWIKPGQDEPVNAWNLQNAVSFYEELVQLLHPYMPFLTEEIYHLLADRAESDDLCIRQFIPVDRLQPAGSGQPDAAYLAQGELLKQVITGIRDQRNKAQLKPKDIIQLALTTADSELYTTIQSILLKQVNAASLSYVADAVPGTIAAVIGKDRFYIGSDKAVDKGMQKDELQKELLYLTGFVASCDKKLSNERFVQHAKPEVVEMEKKKREDAIAKITIINASLSNLD